MNNIWKELLYINTLKGIAGSNYESYPDTVARIEKAESRIQQAVKRAHSRVIQELKNIKRS